MNRLQWLLGSLRCVARVFLYCQRHMKSFSLGKISFLGERGEGSFALTSSMRLVNGMNFGKVRAKV